MGLSVEIAKIRVVTVEADGSGVVCDFGDSGGADVLHQKPPG